VYILGPTARSDLHCRRFCFWRRQSVVFLFVYEISRTIERIGAKFTRKTCLVPRWDEFEGPGQRSKSLGAKTHFSALFGGLWAVCVW